MKCLLVKCFELKYNANNNHDRENSFNTYFYIVLHTYFNKHALCS